MRPACPTLAPVGIDSEGSLFRQGKHWTFTAGGAGYEDPRKNRPPAFVHVVVQAGDLSDVFETFDYSRTRVFTPEDGIMLGAERGRLARLGLSGHTPQGLYFGSVTWNWRRGDLVLAPPFRYVDSIHADHLIFVWTHHDTQYAISLHAWEPFLQTLSALHQMVDSLPCGA